MKICLIYDFLTEIGGLEREMVNHARMLKEEGHDVEILTCHLDPEAVKKTGLGEIKIRVISKIKSKYELISLVSCFLGMNKLKYINPSAIISYSLPSNYLIRNKKVRRINFMNHFPHFLYLKEKEKAEWASGTKGSKRQIARVLSWFLGSWLRKIDKKYVKSAKINFSNSNFTKKRLDEIYNIESIASYPPLDPVFKPSKEKIKDRFVFSSSRIIPDKKYEWLISAVSLMENRIPLYISGQGKEDYQRKLKALGKAKRVKIKFLGRLSTEDLIKSYSSAEVVAFSTPGEDFGLVPAESLACGTPVVVWGDGAGPTEQVIHGVNGYHAKPYDLEDFAKKMDLAINSKIKTKNREKILNSAKRFSYNEVKKVFLGEINMVLSRSS